MKKIFFRFTSLLVLIYLVASLVGCTKKTEEATGQASTKVAEDQAPRTVVDHTGVEVTLPAKMDRILIAGLMPMPSVYCLYTGSSQRLVGIPASSQAAAKNSLLIEAYPELGTLPTDFEANGVINVERILELNPDIVFYGSSNAQTRQALDNAGIPAVGFSTTRQGTIL